MMKTNQTIQFFSKEFLLLFFSLNIIFFISCSKSESSEEKPYKVNITIEDPEKGELVVFIPDSLKRKPSKWKPYHRVDSTGVVQLNGEINQPEFFYLQLGKTPVLSDLIIYPGDVVDIKIQGENIKIVSNEDQEILTKFNSLNYEEKIDYIQKYLKSPVLLKGLEYWNSKVDITTEMESAVKYYSKNHPQWEITKKMEKELEPLLRLKTGKIAPTFKFPDSIRNVISLADFKGKYLLIDFWGSWCKPCIKEFPEMKGIYEKYKGDNFEVLGVALDKNEKWKNALVKYELPWVNVIDEKRLSEKIYSLNSFPTTYFINPEGVIISKKARVNKGLDDLLKKHLISVNK